MGKGKRLPDASALQVTMTVDGPAASGPSTLASVGNWRARVDRKGLPRSDMSCGRRVESKGAKGSDPDPVAST